MASVVKVLKQLSDIQNEKNRLSFISNDSFTASNVLTLKTMFQQLRQLRDSLHNMQSKFGQIDPITGGECFNSIR